ncbi:MAG: ferredoxin [Clostridia bacterium]|nr:ferredoxin [Clostridia bacterium]
MGAIRVSCVFFSPTGATEKAAGAVVQGMIACGDAMGVTAFDERKPACRYIDASRPEVREEICEFGKEDFVVLASPTYASRVPNKIMPFFRDNLKGNGARAVVIVTYGNRSYGDALMEMALMAKDNGFTVVGAAAVPSEHAFAPGLGTGRPDANDLAELRAFGRSISEVAGEGGAAGADIESGEDGAAGTDIEPGAEKEAAGLISRLPGNNPVGPYYTPKKVDGAPAMFLKAKPKTDTTKCQLCGFCWRECPMGSVEAGHPENVKGVCIKCQRCVKGCIAGARSFDDEDFLSHRQMLVKNFGASKVPRKKVEFYL